MKQTTFILFLLLGLCYGLNAQQSIRQMSLDYSKSNFKTKPELGLRISSLPPDQRSYRLVRKSNGKLKVIINIPEKPESKRVWISNGIIISSGIVGFGILLALPEDYTNWNKDEIKFSTVVSNWRENVSGGLVVDQDNLFLNYLMHPYFGAVYYMTLRGAGYQWWASGLYSAGMSTLFWEFGIEAFAEKPSLQDVIITPVVGSVIGELFFVAKKAIKGNNDKILGSGFLGHSCMFLMDPLNEVQDWFKMSTIKKNVKRDYVTNSYWQLDSKVGLTINFQVKF